MGQTTPIRHPLQTRPSVRRLCLRAAPHLVEKDYSDQNGRRQSSSGAGRSSSRIASIVMQTGFSPRTNRPAQIAPVGSPTTPEMPAGSTPFSSREISPERDRSSTAGPSIRRGWPSAPTKVASIRLPNPLLTKARRNPRCPAACSRASSRSSFGPKRTLATRPVLISRMVDRDMGRDLRVGEKQRVARLAIDNLLEPDSQ